MPADSVSLWSVKDQSATVKKVNGGDYNLYAGTTSQRAKIGTVKAGKSVTLLHRGGTWSLVKVGNLTGYVQTKLLNINK